MSINRVQSLVEMYYRAYWASFGDAYIPVRAFIARSPLIKTEGTAEEKGGDRTLQSLLGTHLVPAVVLFHVQHEIMKFHLRHARSISRLSAPLHNVFQGAQQALDHCTFGSVWVVALTLW